MSESVASSENLRFLEGEEDARAERARTVCVLGVGGDEYAGIRLATVFSWAAGTFWRGFGKTFETIRSTSEGLRLLAVGWGRHPASGTSERDAVFA